MKTTTVIPEILSTPHSFRPCALKPECLRCDRCGEPQSASIHLSAEQQLLNVKTALLESSEKECDELREALRWCSGSTDFAPEGQAREGWLKICAPLLAQPQLPESKHASLN